MTKAEWEEAYNEIDRAHTELAEYEREYRNGSNKQKRKNGEREMDFVIHRVKFLLGKYNEVYILASGGEKATDFSRAVVMDEFLSHRYIVRDLQTLLYNMREKINSLENENPNFPE